MVPDSSVLATDVISGAIEFAAADKSAPRLVVAGDSDIFAPMPKTTTFADSIGAKLATNRGARALADWRTRARTCNQ